jgi:hypothetical protein
MNSRGRACPRENSRVSKLGAYIHVTDASKTCSGKVGIVCYVKITPFVSAIGRITDEVSVFAGELAAIQLSKAID